MLGSGTKINTHTRYAVVCSECQGLLRMEDKPYPAESLEILAWQASEDLCVAFHADKFAFIP